MRVPVARNSRRLSFALVLIAIVVLGSTGSIIFYALTALAARTNQIEAELTAETGRAALRALEHRVRDINSEFSHGDYAQTPNRGLSLFERRVADLCAGTKLGVNFDIAYLVDDSMRNLAGCVGGQRMSEDPTRLMGRALAPIIRDISAPTRRKTVRSGFMLTRFGIASVAVGSAWWNPAGSGGEPPVILIIGKRLDEPAVKRMSRDFAISGLRLVTDITMVNPAAAVREPDGRIIGGLAWTPRNPGNTALDQILPTVLANLLFLAAAFAAMIGAVWWAFQAVHDSNRKSAHAAVHDQLTGLPNRAALISMLERISGQNDQEASIIFIDLDGFKEVNDFYGHEMGDRLLRGFGAGLTSLVGNQGLVARVGGDEFVVLLIGPAVRSAQQLAAAAISLSHEPLRVGPHNLKIEASIGLASSNFEAIAGEELLRRADLAMYEAKRRGGSNIAVYSNDIDAEMKRRMKMAEEIRQGLANREFWVACQPIVAAGDLRPVAMEILARWNRTDGSIVSPAEFIKVAEEQGIIDDLGEFLLEEACAVACTFKTLRFSLNVSALQMRSMEFLSRVDRSLKRFAIDPARLQIEMKESKILLDGSILRPVIDGLKARGIRLVLDDFGTGYASIAYLRQFRFDGLKLDRSICSEVAKSVNALMMAQGMILVAKAAGLEVVAEGVENKEQANLLKLAGCTHLQGYLFGRPYEAAQADWARPGALEISAPTHQT